MRRRSRRTSNWLSPAAMRRQHVQCVVMVRDDFWLAVSRFMESPRSRLVEGRELAAIDLFDPRHARKVLAAFRDAYGNLPDRTAEISREQNAFLDQAITELAQDGKVISVRLALFAEMVKGKPWTPADLAEVGGTEGVGVHSWKKRSVPRRQTPNTASTRKPLKPF